MQRPPPIVLSLVASLLAPPSLGSAGRVQDPAQHGRALLDEFCASCHAVGKTGASPMRGAPPFRALGHSFDPDQFPRLLRRGISSSHPAMPEFKFSDDDARAATAYLRSIQE
ncbi:MAG TPA: cytochrome c [Pseudolabrys sp.]